MSFRCTVSRTYDAPSRVVFEALTRPARIRTWSGQRGSVASRVGGPFSLFDGWVVGKVQSYKPERSFAVSWRPVEWDEGTPPSTVEYTLSRKGKKTLLRIAHSGLPSARERDDHKAGWVEHVLDPLSDYLGGL